MPSESPVSYSESLDRVWVPSSAADALNSYMESLEGDRILVKAVTELGMQSTAPKEGFDTPLSERVALGAAPAFSGEGLVPSLPDDKCEQSAILSLFFATTEPRSVE